jgi:hypothetical protein
VSGHRLVCRGTGEGERVRGGHRAPPGQRRRHALATRRARPAAVGTAGRTSERGRRPRGRGLGHGCARASGSGCGHVRGRARPLGPAGRKGGDDPFR